MTLSIKSLPFYPLTLCLFSSLQRTLFQTPELILLAQALGFLISLPLNPLLFRLPTLTFHPLSRRTSIPFDPLPVGSLSHSGSIGKQTN